MIFLKWFLRMFFSTFVFCRWSLWWAHLDLECIHTSSEFLENKEFFIELDYLALIPPADEKDAAIFQVHLFMMNICWQVKEGRCQQPIIYPIFLLSFCFWVLQPPLFWKTECPASPFLLTSTRSIRILIGTVDNIMAAVRHGPILDRI